MAVRVSAGRKERIGTGKEKECSDSDRVKKSGQFQDFKAGEHAAYHHEPGGGREGDNPMESWELKDETRRERIKAPKMDEWRGF